MKLLYSILTIFCVFNKALDDQNINRIGLTDGAALSGTTRNKITYTQGDVNNVC